VFYNTIITKLGNPTTKTPATVPQTSPKPFLPPTAAFFNDGLPELPDPVVVLVALAEEDVDEENGVVVELVPVVREVEVVVVERGIGTVEVLLGVEEDLVAGDVLVLGVVLLVEVLLPTDRLRGATLMLAATHSIL